jgi:hypothetical protein
MDDLTESQRRQIYEEEKQKEGERRRRRGRRPDLLWLAVIAFLVLFVAAIPIVGQAGLVERALAGNEAQVREAGKYPTAPPDALPTPAPTPATGIRTTFSDGVWVIGDQMPPGTYRAEPPSSGCYWARVGRPRGTRSRGQRSPGPGGREVPHRAAGRVAYAGADAAESSDLTRLNARSTAATDAGAWSAGIKSPTEVVWIQDTDAAFETVGCGIWRRLAE